MKGYKKKTTTANGAAKFHMKFGCENETLLSPCTRGQSLEPYSCSLNLTQGRGPLAFEV